MCCERFLYSRTRRKSVTMQDNSQTASVSFFVLISIQFNTLLSLSKKQRDFENLCCSFVSLGQDPKFLLGLQLAE